MIIAVDFDGTCVTHEYPKVGREIGAVEVLKKLVAKGHHLILFTMRSGKELEDAVDWFKGHSIPLYGVNTNPTQKDWTQSPKAYAQLYIDDAALGCPLAFEVNENKSRAFVAWGEVELILKRRGIL